MYGFIYLTTCVITGSIYVGQRKIKHSKLDDTYLGSGLLLKKAISKYGKINFTRDIIDFAASQEDLDDKEVHWIAEYKRTHGSKCLNISLGGLHGGSPILNHPNRDDIIKKKKATYKATPHLPKAPIVGHKHSELTKLKMSLRKKGQPGKSKGMKRTPEQCKALSERMKGNTPWNKGLELTAYQKRNLYRIPKGTPPHNKGKRASSETREKIRLATLGNKNMLGKKHSQKTKQLISLANKGNRAWNEKEILQIDPISFEIIKVWATRKLASISANATTNHRAAKSKLRVKSGGFFWLYKIDATQEEILNNKVEISNRHERIK